MENGLPFALPVLNLFQRLPVEEKAGAITYVAVTSVPRAAGWGGRFGVGKAGFYGGFCLGYLVEMYETTIGNEDFGWFLYGFSFILW